MLSNEFTKTIEELKEGLGRSIVRTAKEIAFVESEAVQEKLTEVAALESLADISYTSIYVTWEKRLRLVFYLEEDRKDSPLVRDLVKIFGGKATKKPDFDKKALDVEWTTERFELIVHRYLPASCRIEEYTEEVPEHVVPAAFVPRFRVICSDPEAEEAPA